jgi:hypothetical protein
VILVLIAAVWLITALATVALCAAAAQGDRELQQAPAPEPPARPRGRTWVRGSRRAGAPARRTHA